MKIGIGGASGQLGSGIIAHLLKQGGDHSIVAITRTPDKITQPGIEARYGDYDQPASLLEAYKELDRVVLIPSMDLAPGRRGEQFVDAIDAADTTGVGRVVLMSAAGTREAPSGNVAGDYYRAEQHLMGNVRRWSILRMSYYAESFLQEVQSSLGFGVITGVAENKVSFVARDDLAAAAAGLLVGEGHAGAIYTGTGPATFTGADRAALASRLAGKPLAYLTLPIETIKAQLAQAGLPPVVVDVIAGLKQNFANGDFDIVTGDIEKLSGQAPQSLESILSAGLT